MISAFSSISVLVSIKGVPILIHNKETPEGVYAGCVGVRKNCQYVQWQWKVDKCTQQMCAGETEMFC